MENNKCLAKKIDKLDSTKIKNFCSSKDTGKRIKSQATEWEKIFAKYIFDKCLIFRIYKEVSKVKKEYNLIKKLGKRFNTTTWKDAQHNQSWRKYKLKPQWDTTADLAHCLK